MTAFLESAPSGVLWLVFFVAASIPITFVHELGHALVARRRLGGEVEIVVGTVGKIAELQLARIRISINALADPRAAAGTATFDVHRATARDVLLIALAGPTASLACAALTGCAMSLLPPGRAHDALWAATFAGVFSLLLNLVPYKLTKRRKLAGVSSDGLLALEALRLMRGV